MIEFKASYYRPDSPKALAVLVQFDGSFLHVWHLSDPFYRLISSDDFMVIPEDPPSRGLIKISNGVRIESDDHRSLFLLKEKSESLRQKRSRKALTVPILVIVASVLFLILGVWLSTQT